MSKIKTTILMIFVIIILFNKKIVSYYYLNKLSNWVERPVKLEKLDFNYSGYVEIIGIEILNTNKNYYKNIFKAEKIIIQFDIISLFSDLIIIKSFNVINPEFFLDINILKEVKELGKQKTFYDDNIGLAKKINEKTPDKIWPKKNKDVNFLVNQSVLSGAKGHIKVSTISKPYTIELSKMNFSSFGNDKKHKHYKDILKSILFDLYSRSDEFILKKTLKKIYKF